MHDSDAQLFGRLEALTIAVAWLLAVDERADDLPLLHGELVRGTGTSPIAGSHAEAEQITSAVQAHLDRLFILATQIRHVENRPRDRRG